jgi:hypothetical protein
MKSPAKGAFVMVIAGAITFSAANGILKANNLFSAENSSVLTGIQKKSKEYRQINKKTEEKTLAVKQNEIHKTEAENTPSSGESLKKAESNKAVAAVHKDTESSSGKPAVKPVIKTQSVSAKKPSDPEPASAPSGKTTASEPAKPVTSPKDSQIPSSGRGVNNAASPAEKASNYGQAVSQAAKEKAESSMAVKGKENKESKGKN